MKIDDNNGVWLKNTAQYRFQDPDSGTCFEPGEAVKAKLTDWVVMQPCIVRVEDPTSEATEKSAAALEALQAEDDAARLARDANADAIHAADNARMVGADQPAVDLPDADAEAAAVVLQPAMTEQPAVAGTAKAKK